MISQDFIIFYTIRLNIINVLKKKRSKQKDTQLPIPFDNIPEVEEPKTKKKDNVVNPMIRNKEVDYSPETGEKGTNLFTDGKSKKICHRSIEI